MSLPPCPKCSSEYTYEDGALLICPECAHEWSATESTENDANTFTVRDANGNLLMAGDIVTLIKDLKVKGTSSVIKVGTKAKINRLVDGEHNIDCKLEVIGEMMLKSVFVKKA